MSEAGGVPAGREAERYASMRHRKSGRKLGRSPSHRKALMRNLAVSLFRYEKIETTLAKAKEARPFVERLITMARRGTLADRRRALAILAVEGSDPVEGKDKGIVRKLFDDIGPRYVGRPGGYTRVLKLSKWRLGDGTQQALLELIVPEAAGAESPKPKVRPEPEPAVQPAGEPETSAQSRDAQPPQNQDPESAP